MQRIIHVATVLTACGIETLFSLIFQFSFYIAMLQQYLPLAVLKRYASNNERTHHLLSLQQYLPLAVLKL